MKIGRQSHCADMAQIWRDIAERDHRRAARHLEAGRADQAAISHRLARKAQDIEAAYRVEAALTFPPATHPASRRSH